MEYVHAATKGQVGQSWMLNYAHWMLNYAQVRQRLAEEFKLRTEKKLKPIMRAEDEFELLKTLWSSPELALGQERLRVQLALIMQLAGITGNRPGALPSLRYEHLKVTLLRDPAGSEWPRLLIELTFKNTKGYLGLKDAYVELEFGDGRPSLHADDL